MSIPPSRNPCCLTMFKLRHGSLPAHGLTLNRPLALGLEAASLQTRANLWSSGSPAFQLALQILGLGHLRNCMSLIVNFQCIYKISTLLDKCLIVPYVYGYIQKYLFTHILSFCFCGDPWLIHSLCEVGKKSFQRHQIPQSTYSLPCPGAPTSWHPLVWSVALTVQGSWLRAARPGPESCCGTLTAVGPPLAGT